MPPPIDLTNQTFGKWNVLSYVGNTKWRCRCACGKERDVDGGSLRHGRSRACTSCHVAIGHMKTHGEKRTRLYSIWSGIIRRCENPNEPAHARYGARGITVCAEWRTSFVTFRDWALNHGYRPNLTIDRKENDKGYEPSNCRWATHAEQNRNYSRNRPIEYRGRSVLVCDLAIEVGLPQGVLNSRIFRYGWPVEEAVAIPVMARGQRRAVSFKPERRNIDAPTAKEAAACPS